MRSLDAHYFLLHAFDRLGRRLHGDEWDAQEYKVAPCRSPEEIEAQRRELQNGLDEIAAKIDALNGQIGKTVNADEIASFKQRMDELEAARTDIREVFYRLPHDMTGPQRDWDRHTRKQQTELLLLQALTDEKLFAYEPGGMRIEWRSWSLYPGFKCSLDLSLIRVPAHCSGQRRMSVLLHKEDFDKWLQTVLPVSESALAQTSPEDRCRAWLVEIALPSAPPARKAEMCSEAMQRFPGLSERAFNRLWDAIAPEHWKKSGRRKGA